MLAITGKAHRFCDGIARRSFMKIGGLALGGASMVDIMRAESRATNGNAVHGSKKSIIMIFLAGGISHQDSWDLKPKAPDGVRGEFKPIQTKIPGIEICEHMPKMAQMIDKFSIIRSIVDSAGGHDLDQCLSGYPRGTRQTLNHPCIGSVAAKVLGATSNVIPAFMGLTKDCGHKPWADVGAPGRMGRGYAPVQPDGRDLEAMVLKQLTLEQLQSRKQLLSSFDQYRREIDSSAFRGADSIYDQAFDVLTSNKLLEALDVSKEPEAVRERYGHGSPKNIDDGPPCWNDQILMSRRLIEAGVRCVTVSFGRWDYHGKNFTQMKERLPLLDQSLTALVQDLHDRGLDKDTSVIVWGEFGRTPKINGNAGRDHWSKANCAVLACGGIKTGQVIGSTTPDAGEPASRPVKFQEVFATLYHNLGIDPNAFVRDETDTPFKLLPQDTYPMRELV